VDANTSLVSAQEQAAAANNIGGEMIKEKLTRQAQKLALATDEPLIFIVPAEETALLTPLGLENPKSGELTVAFLPNQVGLYPWRLRRAAPHSQEMTLSRTHFASELGLFIERELLARQEGI
jgi:hypothetical protein